jgi:hypothetical protein
MYNQVESFRFLITIKFSIIKKLLTITYSYSYLYALFFSQGLILIIIGLEQMSRHIIVEPMNCLNFDQVYATEGAR